MKTSHWKTVAFLSIITTLLAVMTFGGAGMAYALSQTETPSVLTQADEVDPERGLVIVAVDGEGPAAAAGIVRGDILQGVDGSEIGTVFDLHSALDTVEPGDEVKVEVLHGDEILTLAVVVGDRSGLPYMGLTPYAMAAIGGGFVPGMQELDRLSEGAVIIDVVEDSPAAAADLAAGDVIIAVEDQAVDAEHGLADLIAEYDPGDQVMLEIAKAGEEGEQVSVELAEHPDREGIAFLGVQYAPIAIQETFRGDGTPFEGRPFEDLPFENLPFGEDGFPFDDMPGSTVEKGAVVITVVPDSPAAEAGLQEDVLIIAIDGDEVDTPEAIVDLISSKSPGDTITLTVKEQGVEETSEVEVTLGEHPTRAGAGYLGVEIGLFLKMEQFQEGTLPIPDMFRFRMPHGQDHFEFHREFDLDSLPFDLDQLPFDLDELHKQFDFDFDFQTPPGFGDSPEQSL
ncbi:MAG: PDZ domain-containing protein [Chloroflexi bacterium]|nr:PDZ domain-containing protein [Chloroflexota bacterium]